MKRFLSNRFFAVLYGLFFLRLWYYKNSNKRKKKIVIYTDSRGHDIAHLRHKRNPFSSYSKHFIKHYCAEVCTLPERHTTFYDFLTYMAGYKEPYDWVIAHVGVVCFAPRPLSQMKEVLHLKKEKIISLFGVDIFRQLEDFEGYDISYKGENTSSLVPDFMIPHIAEKLNEIKNLVWINCNGVAEGWVGNYKERPDNLGIVRSKSLLLSSYLSDTKVVDLTAWTDEEIKKYTCDNVHLTQGGMDYIKDKLRQIIE